MQHPRPGHLSGGLQPADRVAGAGRRRVPRRGDDDGDGGLVAPAQPGGLCQLTGRGGVQQPGQRGDQPGEHDLGLGVAEPGVELHHPQPPGGQRQTAVQQPGEGGAAAGELVHAGLGDPRHDLGDEPGRRPRQRRVGAHPSGVRPGVAVADPFEVLCGGERDDGAPVGEAEQRHLGAVEVLLDDDPAVGAVQAGGCVGEGGVGGVGDDHALAGGQPVILDHVGGAERVEGPTHLVEGGAHARHRRGHARRGHDLLGEGLAALQSGGLRGRSEAGDAAAADGIGGPRDQRHLGADHDEVGGQAGGQAGNRLRVGDVDRATVGAQADPGVARRADHGVHGRVGGQCADEGVFPGAGTDHEHLHNAHRSEPAPPERDQARDAPRAGSRRLTPPGMSSPALSMPQYPAAHSGSVIHATSWHRPRRKDDRRSRGTPGDRPGPRAFRGNLSGNLLITGRTIGRPPGYSAIAPPISFRQRMSSIC